MMFGSVTAATAFIKNNYYSGKLLHASDFLREQEYGNRKLEFINRSFHGCGIVEGLEVRMEDGTLHISGGSAIDPRGRILLVPSGTGVNVRKLEGLQEIPAQDFILGIRYAERTTEEERSYLEPDQPYRGARIEETFALRAYTLEEWKELKASADEKAGTLTEETVLFQDENVRLVVMTPRAVPSDSIFRCRIQARVLHGNSASLKWRCMATLQGAFFAETGQAVLSLDGEEAVFSGTVTREWEICTEENRKYPITLELTHLEVRSGSFEAGECETCRLCIETEPSYEDIVHKYLLREGRTHGAGPDWLPLAYIKAVGAPRDTQGAFEVSVDQEVRFRAFCPAWEQVCRQEAERNGIVDIRWRGLLNMLRQPQPPLPVPQPPFPGPQPLQPVSPEPRPLQPGPLEPQPRDPFPVQPQYGFLTEQVKEQIRALVREQTEGEREGRIRRGIAVIHVPGHYRRGQVLFSDEIAHGFPGEEVFICCGRVLEEKNYAYWSRDKMRYSVFSGDEGLFPDPGDSGWKIGRQAVRQNVEDGTFQVALTLSKGRGKERCREIAVSWVAVKIV